MGYFITPMISIILGYCFLKEKISKLKMYAVILMILAILILFIYMDGIPYLVISIGTTWAIEIAITLLLMYSIHVLVRRNSSLFTLALGVGTMVGVLAFFFGGFTGASMNPARTLGPNIVTDNGNLILYTVAPVIGAVLANFIPEPLGEEP